MKIFEELTYMKNIGDLFHIFWETNSGVNVKLYLISYLKSIINRLMTYDLVVIFINDFHNSKYFPIFLKYLIHFEKMTLIEAYSCLDYYDSEYIEYNTPAWYLCSIYTKCYDPVQIITMLYNTTITVPVEHLLRFGVGPLRALNPLKPLDVSLLFYDRTDISRFICVRYDSNPSYWGMRKISDLKTEEDQLLIFQMCFSQQICFCWMDGDAEFIIEEFFENHISNCINPFQLINWYFNTHFPNNYDFNIRRKSRFMSIKSCFMSILSYKKNLFQYINPIQILEFVLQSGYNQYFDHWFNSNQYFSDAWERFSQIWLEYILSPALSP